MSELESKHYLANGGETLPDAREALESVLNEYNGTILFVSHDRYFIDAVADTIWMVQDETIERFNGTYSDYVADREARERAALKAASAKPAFAKPAMDERKPAAVERHATPAKPTSKIPQTGGKLPNGKAATPHPDDREQRRRQRRLSALEEEIGLLEKEINQLEQELGMAGSDVKKITSLGLQHSELQAMLQTRYDEWAAFAG